MKQDKNTARQLNDKNNSNRILSAVLWPLIFASQLIIAALLSWHLLAQFEFAYPLAYDSIDIDKHIETFGPKNRYRPDFETTSKEDHLTLFNAIGVAIQNHGYGLADISYQAANGKTHSLLRKPEVIHLEDVAKLVDIFYLAGYVSFGILVIGLIVAHKKNLPLPSGKNVALGIVILLAIVGLVFAIVGAKPLFYWLHIQIFPPDHEWFFYYQDSLMTTLMKAPDLFGFIGAIMGSILLVLWITEILLLRSLFPNAKKNPDH